MFVAVCVNSSIPEGSPGIVAKQRPYCGTVVIAVLALDHLPHSWRVPVLPRHSQSGKQCCSDSLDERLRFITTTCMLCRRISNRESARRLRKQRSEKLTALMSQQDSLMGLSNGLASQIGLFQQRLHTLTCENRALLLRIRTGTKLVCILASFLPADVLDHTCRSRSDGLITIGGHSRYILQCWQLWGSQV